MVTYIILGILLVAVVLLVVLIVRSKPAEKNDSEQQYLQNDINNLRQQVADLQSSLNQTLNERMDKTQLSMQEQLNQSAKIVQDVSNRLTKLDDTNKRVVDVATELKTLQNVLRNPKQRGVFGEFQLNSLLENVLPPKQWQPQYKFKDGVIVDAVIFLDKGKILPVDSKFSLENYNRYVEAANPDEKKLYMNRVRNDLKGRIDETAKYIRPDENTMDFAFMFIPSESLYYDLLSNNVGLGGSSRDLIEYAFRDKHVIITSPTSFMAYLETILQGLRSLSIEEQAKEIQKRVGQLGVHIKKYDEYMNKLGNSLSTTVNHYNNAYREFGKIDKDVVKIAADGRTVSVEPLQIDKPSAE